MNKARVIANALNGTSRTQMISQLDGLIAHWAATSAMETSIQSADKNGFTLYYLPPGMSVDDYFKTDHAVGGGGGGGDAEMSNSDETDRLEILEDQMKYVEKLIGLLERFNGLQFVNVEDSGVRTGQGQKLDATTGSSGSALEGQRYVFVPLNSAQVSLLEQSYAQLKQSVYDGLVMQTRLKPYLDAITLNIDEKGVRLDYSERVVANDFEWRRVA